MWLIAAAFVFFLGAIVLMRPVRRYEVAGESMLPSYAPGDRLIAESVSYRLREPRVGEVVIVSQPGSNGRSDLKRIVAAPGEPVQVLGEDRHLTDDEWFVVGDNLGRSTDSRTLGPVRRRDILARVWIQY